MVPSMSLLAEKINELTPKRLYNFYRYFNGLENDGSPMYEAIRTLLGYSNNLEKATSFILQAEKNNNIFVVDAIYDIDVCISFFILIIKWNFTTILNNKY